MSKDDDKVMKKLEDISKQITIFRKDIQNLNNQFRKDIQNLNNQFRKDIQNLNNQIYEMKTDIKDIKSDIKSYADKFTDMGKRYLEQERVITSLSGSITAIEYGIRDKIKEEIYKDEYVDFIVNRLKKTEPEVSEFKHIYQ